MHLYIELWKAKPAWLALPKPKRAEYVAALGPEIGKLLQAGVELVGFALMDADTPHRADYRYLAVWKMPDTQTVLAFESAVEQSGFHGYFEQVNARGQIVPPQVALGDMVQL